MGTAPPGLVTGERVGPPTKPLKLPGLDTELRVWDGSVDFVIPVRADDRIASLVSEIPNDEISIEIRVDYQACDDQACRIP